MHIYDYPRIEFRLCTTDFAAFRDRPHHVTSFAAPERYSTDPDEKPADLLLRIAIQELKSCHEHFIKRTVKVTEVMIYRFLTAAFDREERIGRVYPWLLALEPGANLSKSAEAIAALDLEARLGQLEPDVLEPQRYTPGELKLIPAYDALARRDRITTFNLPLITDELFSFFAAYAVVEYLYRQSRPNGDRSTMGERFADAYQRNIRLSLKNEVHIWAAQVGLEAVENLIDEMKPDLLENIAKREDQIMAHLEFVIRAENNNRLINFTDKQWISFLKSVNYMQNIAFKELQYIEFSEDI